YASGLNGYAGLDPDVRDGDMTPRFQTIVDKVPPPDVDRDGPFQLQVSSLDYNSYVCVIGIGRLKRRTIKANSPVAVMDGEGNKRSGRLLQILGFMGLERVEVEQASAGDIIAFTGIDELN